MMQFIRAVRKQQHSKVFSRNKNPLHDDIHHYQASMS